MAITFLTNSAKVSLMWILNQIVVFTLRFAMKEVSSWGGDPKTEVRELGISYLKVTRTEKHIPSKSALVYVHHPLFMENLNKIPFVSRLSRCRILCKYYRVLSLDAKKEKKGFISGWLISVRDLVLKGVEKRMWMRKWGHTKDHTEKLNKLR